MFSKIPSQAHKVVFIVTLHPLEGKGLIFFLFVDPTVKKVNNPEYRHYLKLWNEEAKPKKENSKDLPKLNQVRFSCRMGTLKM